MTGGVNAPDVPTCPDVPAALPVPAASAAAMLAADGRGAATHVAFAPGRVNLIGEHTDYNGGFVLPFAIEGGIWIAARPRPDRAVRVVSAQYPDAPAEFALDQPLRPDEPAWGRYVGGVLAGLIEAGAELPGWDAAVHATLPVGGGVSSSAALETAVAVLAEELSGFRQDPERRALLCQRAEHEFAGTPCGIMDQFAVSLAQEGHLLLIDCRTQATRHVPMPVGEVSFLVFNTMVRHALNDGAYRNRRDDCHEAARLLGVPDLRAADPGMLAAACDVLPERLFRRARHVVTENARTLAAVQALTAADWAETGRLMFASHASLRDDFEVSCPELDAVVAAARALGPEAGVHGCRMTGGGFGGCCVALVAAASAEAVRERLLAAYHEATGIAGTAFLTFPSGGPRVLRLS